MAKTIGTSELTEVWGSDRVGQGAPSIVTPDLGTIEKGFITGKANSNDFTYVSNELGKKINHILQNGVPAWNTTTAYVAGNVVSNEGAVWIATANNTNSDPSNTNANWRKLATVDLIPTLNSLLPSQTGNANKVLTTNGTNASWANVPFATVNFDGTTAANLTGTFTRTGNTVTVNVTGHGHIVGHRIYFASTPLNEWGTVATVIDANSFTYTSGTSGTISSTACTLQRRSIRQSINVQSVPYGVSISDYTVNLATSYGSTNYLILGTAQSDVSELLGFYRPQPAIAVKTALHFNFFTAGTGTGNRYNSAEVSIAIF